MKLFLMLLFLNLPFFNATALAENSGNGTILITGGYLSDQVLGQGNWEIAIKPGQQISGEVKIVSNNFMPSGAVAPLGYTWTWGNRQTALIEIDRWIGPGENSWTVPIDLIAPVTPGTYYVLFGFNGEFNMSQVMSVHNWSAPKPILWNDGNDYHDIDDNRLHFASQNGYINDWRYFWGDGTYKTWDIPVGPIRIVVSEDGPSPPPSTLAELESLSGLWYDSNQPGDGFNTVVVEQPGKNPIMFTFFYGYDESGNRMWLISDNIELVDGVSSYSTTMHYASGSGFAGAGDHSLSEWGALDFAYYDCGKARFTLNKGSQSVRTWDATQLADVPGAGCLLGDGPRAFQTISGLSGPWFKENEPGDGFNIIVTNAGLVTYFYGYDQDGNLLWLISDTYNGPILPGRLVTLDMFQGSGGYLTDVNNSSISKWGTLSLLFRDCNSADVSLEGSDGERDFSVVQLAGVAGALCEAPGAISLSESTLTFEGTGKTRTVEYSVTNSTGNTVSPTHVKYSFRDNGVAKATTLGNGVARFEATTNEVIDTQVRFWDPINNAVQDLSVVVVDLRPGVIFLSESNVISWQVPTKTQNTSIRLKSNSETNDIKVDDLIASESGLIAKVHSASLVSNEVHVEGTFASYPEIYRNLYVSSDEYLSSAQYSLKSDQLGLDASPSRKDNDKNRFEMLKVGNSLDAVECESQSSSISGQFDLGPRFDLRLAESIPHRTLKFDENGFVIGVSKVSFDIRLLGDLELGLDKDVQQGILINCTIANFDLKTPSLYTAVGPFRGYLPLEAGFKFSIQQEFPDPIRLDIGALFTVGIDFEKGNYSGGITGGLAENRWVNFSGFSIKNLTVDTEASFEPFIKGSMGIDYFWGAARLTFADAYLGIPYHMSWPYPELLHLPDFSGPSQSWSLVASAKLQPKVDSILFDRLDIDPIPITSGLDLFTPIDYTLYETPRIGISEHDCGSLCGVGDKRTFTIGLKQNSLFDSTLYGTAFLLSDKTESTWLDREVISGKTPQYFWLSFTPSEAGTHTVMPRFKSHKFGTIYGGNSLIIEVDSNVTQYQLSVGRSGSGAVTSSPGGINCGSDCSETFDQGTQVTLTANAASGWQLDHWAGECSGNGLSCTFTMNGNRTVSAYFSEVVATKYRLSASKSGSGAVTSSPGGISCGSDCSQDYDQGTQVTLTASPISGWQFDNWSGACSGTSSTCYVTMNNNQSVAAYFSQKPTQDVECYQEHANQSNTCGASSGGTYSSDGNWNDGIWDSQYTKVDSSGLYVTYRKPANAVKAKLKSRIYVWKDSYTTRETEIPQACWNLGSEIRLWVNQYNDSRCGPPGQYCMAIFCYDGYNWDTSVTGSGSVSSSSHFDKIYEEAMIWTIRQ